MDNTKVIIRNVRFSYAHVFQKDNNDKYSVSVIIPKTHPQLTEIRDAIKAAVTSGVAKLGDRYRLQDVKVLHDGDADRPEDKAYAGSFYLSARSNTRPGVVKPNTTGIGGKTTDITDENEFYSGCYGHVSVNFFAFNSGTNKGIACGLNNICKTRDGDYLGGRASAESDFADEDFSDSGLGTETDDLPF